MYIIRVNHASFTYLRTHRTSHLKPEINQVFSRRSELIQRRTGLRSYSLEKTIIQLSNELGQRGRMTDPSIYKSRRALYSQVVRWQASCCVNNSSRTCCIPQLPTSASARDNRSMYHTCTCSCYHHAFSVFNLGPFSVQRETLTTLCLKNRHCFGLL